MLMRGGSFRAFVENPLFLSCTSSWFLAQLTKAIIVLFRGKRKSWRDALGAVMWRTGGMPSSHSALVSALATSLAYREGIGSDLFLVVFFLALMTMRDALGVRRSTGLQARALNSLGKDLSELSNREYHPVKEVHGHSPMEVVTGALLGIIIASAVTFL
ncbi:MAG: divergent PAP2 family protein [Spirochaetaceae bacterium]|jgi:acid phosphatase family membrane protein YuiD|nr:divergent PAP2 family protein [Spirochaetaceae bacterium]